MTQTAIETHYFSYLYDAKDQPIKFSAKPLNTRFKFMAIELCFILRFR
ncbi:ABC transporter substrate-binding protein [Actinobacillus equuli]|nr:ABC transporter substrate-binding protein [Actinobacillus equuli]